MDIYTWSLIGAAIGWYGIYKLVRVDDGFLAHETVKLFRELGIDFDPLIEQAKPERFSTTEAFCPLTRVPSNDGYRDRN